MNIDTLTDIIRDALVVDADILSWCTTNYSTAHTVYKGIDQRQPPNEDEYPIIHIFPATKSVGYALSQKPHIIGVVCGIHDDTKDTTTYTTGVTSVEYIGIAKLEAFRKLVETSIVTEIESNTNTTEIQINSVDIDIDTIEAFPFMLAMNVFELIKPYSQGPGIFD